MENGHTLGKWEVGRKYIYLDDGKPSWAHRSIVTFVDIFPLREMCSDGLLALLTWAAHNSEEFERHFSGYEDLGDCPIFQGDNNEFFYQDGYGLWSFADCEYGIWRVGDFIGGRLYDGMPEDVDPDEDYGGRPAADFWNPEIDDLSS